MSSRARYYITIAHERTRRVSAEVVWDIARRLGEPDLYTLSVQLERSGYVLLRPSDPTRHRPILVTKEHQPD